MATPILPSEPSTVFSVQNPNSINNLLKKTEEQRKQALADTRYDTKAVPYEGFENRNDDDTSAGTVLLAFLLATGVLAGVGFLFRK